MTLSMHSSEDTNTLEPIRIRSALFQVVLLNPLGFYMALNTLSWLVNCADRDDLHAKCEQTHLIYFYGIKLHADSDDHLKSR